jgi:hypothetical protein
VGFIVLAGVFGLLVLGLAFTIYADLAGLLAVGCGAAGVILLARGTRTPAAAGMSFNPPPGWPAAPPGWFPAPGWRPDPSWPEPPADWQWWLQGQPPQNTT